MKKTGSDQMAFNFGGRAVCRRGIVGTITSIATQWTGTKGQRIYYGKTDDGKPWQSVKPKTLVGDTSSEGR